MHAQSTISAVSGHQPRGSGDSRDRRRRHRERRPGQSPGCPATTIGVIHPRHVLRFSGARITYDPIFGTPRELLRYGGYLTGPARGSAVGVARAWLGAHRTAFGLSAAGVRGLVVSRNYTNPASRTHVITFTQVFGGLQAVAG